MHITPVPADVPGCTLMHPVQRRNITVHIIFLPKQILTEEAACKFSRMKNGFINEVHLEVRLKSNYIVTPDDYSLVNIINHFVYAGQYQLLMPVLLLL